MFLALIYQMLLYIQHSTFLQQSLIYLFSKISKHTFSVSCLPRKSKVFSPRVQKPTITCSLSWIGAGAEEGCRAVRAIGSERCFHRDIFTRSTEVTDGAAVEIYSRSPGSVSPKTVVSLGAEWCCRPWQKQKATDSQREHEDIKMSPDWG